MNLWKLPTQGVFGGKSYAVHTDYRDILEIFSYFEDPDLPDALKWRIAMALFYQEAIPEDHLQEAMEFFQSFLWGGRQPSDRPAPKLLDWQQDGEGNMGLCVKGNYFDGSFGAKDNTLTVQYRYKPTGTLWQNTEEEWHILPLSVGDNDYTAEEILTGLDYQTAYTFQARAIDRLATAKSLEYTARATPVFDWGEHDFHIHGSLRIQDRTVVDYVVEQGVVGIWHYRKWASGNVECRCLIGEDNPLWQVWGALHETKLQVALPFAFEKAPWVLATPGAAAGNMIEATRADTNSVEVWVCRPLATGGAYVNLYVCGTAEEIIGGDGAILGTGILGEMTLGKGSE